MRELTDTDRRMMERCRELAASAASAGNTPVGSLVTVGAEVLAEAAEETPAGPVPFAHAELLAIQTALRAADERHLPPATLYTTHEPCFLCTYAIRASRIGRVVIGEAVAEIGGATSAYPLLTTDDVAAWGAPPEVVWAGTW